uniref:Uncharacterized protein n=1 Tax=uncultured prokaryote TaxID=198431 RepID=A0A0H5Q9I5_9ZZZZ|nr:hypothetical protein [uncultured prokaryote]
MERSGSAGEEQGRALGAPSACGLSRLGPWAFFGFCRHKPFPAMLCSPPIDLPAQLPSAAWSCHHRKPLSWSVRSRQGTQRGPGQGSRCGLLTDWDETRRAPGRAPKTGRVNIRHFLPCHPSVWRLSDAAPRTAAGGDQAPPCCPPARPYSPT